MEEQTLTQPDIPASKPFKKSKHKRKPDPLFEMGHEIARTLGEFEKKPRMQIVHILRLRGVEFTQQLLKDTQEIEANGGMLISTGERRRTPGGVFFYLARERLSEDEKMEVFYGWQLAAQRRIEVEAGYPVFEWDERAKIAQQIAGHKGEVSAVKIQITGKPGQIERRQNLVILSVEQKTPNAEYLPKFIPRPPESTTYVVYMTSVQWDRVAELVAQADDEMIIDGFCAYDPELESMAVYAVQTTTKKQLKAEKSLKKPQAEQAGGKKGKKPADKGGDGPRGAKNDRRGQEEPAAPLQVEIHLPDGLPAPVAQKLTELYTAAASFRQKISTLENKPAGQQFGLEMTQKLLRNTEQQIEKLEKQYAPK